MSTTRTVLPPPRARLVRLAERATVPSVCVAVLVAGAGAGYAAWSTNGAGSVQARSAAPQTVTLNVAAGAADLYPGSSGAVSFTVNNPNPYAITLSTLTFGTVTSSDQTACPATNITTTNKTGLSLSVPANSSSTTLTVQAAVAMAASAPDGCQGRTFTIATTATGTQA